ncbi:MAG TPA: hypothetical protein P5511_10105, partial [Candidatus Goldiibacteriota bacterium]|nr:hypothetical protein [Candidatus Goldiibacteriota bacterium]
VAAGSVISGLISSELSRVKKGALLAVFAACFLPYAAYQAPLFGKNGGYLSVVQHESQVFYESALIAERINSAANDSTRLLVLRSNPEIYFLTRKKAATRYVNVTGPMRFFDGKIERELLDYSLKQRPEIIVAENDAKNRFAEALAGYNTVIAGESLEMLAREPRMRPQNSRF